MEPLQIAAELSSMNEQLGTVGAFLLCGALTDAQAAYLLGEVTEVRQRLVALIRQARKSAPTNNVSQPPS